MRRPPVLRRPAPRGSAIGHGRSGGPCYARRRRLPRGSRLAPPPATSADAPSSNAPCQAPSSAAFVCARRLRPSSAALVSHPPSAAAFSCRRSFAAARQRSPLRRRPSAAIVSGPPRDPHRSPGAPQQQAPFAGAASAALHLPPRLHTARPQSARPQPRASPRVSPSGAALLLSPFVGRRPSAALAVAPVGRAVSSGASGVGDVCDALHAVPAARAASATTRLKITKRSTR